jgi:hypothetical protein
MAFFGVEHYANKNVLEVIEDCYKCSGDAKIAFILSLQVELEESKEGAS